VTLRDTAEFLSAAVEATIDGLTLTEADTAAVQLARYYANAIDQNPDPGWALRWLAPLLLDTLTELGATPAARARLTKGGQTPDRAPSGLAKLRSAR
jgi:hypothetical protein